MNQIIIDSVEYEVLKKFSVYYSGWECDHTGYIVKGENDKNLLVMTNHGSKYFASVDELLGLIDTYKYAIKETEFAMEMLK